MKTLLTAAVLATVTAGCAGTAQMTNPMTNQPPQVTDHRGDDDLLTAGLGLKGLQSPVAPAFANAEQPTAAELRRRAIWANWRGIADLAPGGGYGEKYGSTASVPGREFSAVATLPGSVSSHRVVAQIPDQFDGKKRCLLVAPSSGSRGVYGAISVAGAWGLPKGCAVVYTDKGTGTDFADVDTGEGTDLNGQRATGDARVFIPQVSAQKAPQAHEIAFKHAHSQVNPEADWGRHVVQAAQFGLDALSQAFPGNGQFNWENTRVIAVGISNGGGAVLRAAEEQGAQFAAIVAGEPQIHVDGFGSKALYDYSLEALTYMPCAQLALPEGALPEPPALTAAKPLMGLWCQRLKMAGRLDGADVPAMAKQAHGIMRAAGWSDGSLAAGYASTGFDLWRSVLVAYASAYARAPVGAHPCGYRYQAEAADKQARAATAAERAAWWSDSSGIPPGNAISLMHDNPDLYAQLQCLTELRKDPVVAESIAATTASMPANKDTPILILHGKDDGLVPIHYSSIPYVTMLREGGHNAVSFIAEDKAQHFDAFLGFPAYRQRWRPLLPELYRGLDRTWAHIAEGGPMP